jgi:hypothetical protein
MSPKQRFAAIALSALLVLSVVGPALAVAQTETPEQTDTGDGGELTVDVRNGGNDTVVIVVEDENGSVEGATVTVSAVEETDDENETPTETATETPTENETSDNETSDNETDDGYEGTGTYTTGADGPVEIPAPDEGVRLQISVEAGNRTTTSEVTMNDGVGVPFGQRVSLFVQQLLQQDGNASVGQAVSDFVRANNPGNAPEDAGNQSDGERGPPEDAGNDGGGPPQDGDEETEDG